LQYIIAQLPNYCPAIAILRFCDRLFLCKALAKRLL
jgi:hypothetical protein